MPNRANENSKLVNETNFNNLIVSGILETNEKRKNFKLKEFQKLSILKAIINNIIPKKFENENNPYEMHLVYSNQKKKFVKKASYNLTTMKSYSEFFLIPSIRAILKVNKANEIDTTTSQILLEILELRNKYKFIKILTHEKIQIYEIYLSEIEEHKSLIFKKIQVENILFNKNLKIKNVEYTLCEPPKLLEVSLRGKSMFGSFLVSNEKSSALIILRRKNEKKV
jgi:hypothetical protein